MRVALYTRVSTDKQAEKYGIPSQIEALKRMCLEKGLSIVLDGIDTLLLTTATVEPTLIAYII